MDTIFQIIKHKRLKMSLVLKLQKKCLNKEEKLQNLLREALVISTKLKLNEFKQWINYELKGYYRLEDENIPNYREVACSVKLMNPYQGLIPLVINNKEMADILSHVKLPSPISELENLVSKESKVDTISVGLTDRQKITIMKLAKTDFVPYRETPKVQVFRVIEEVRNVLLEWTLKLEEDGILGSDDLMFSEEEKETAKSIHIENFNGVMGDVDKLGNFSTGKKSINTYNENNLALEIDKLIKEIQKLQLQDTQEIIIDLEDSKTNPEKAKKVLGGLLTRGAEVSSITSTIIGILGLFL